jgi:methyltransferase (TIGR00027 family)
MTEAPLIAHISDTARWVAAYRAMESDRSDALFRDPYARRLAGARGQAIVDGLPRAKAVAWPVIVRTRLIDTFIERCIQRDGVDCVLNLACGLDTRPWRMNLPPTLTWLDVDHKVMIDLKTKELASETTKCRYEAVSLDLTDVDGRRALFARVAGDAKKVLVLSEGLLVYLPEAKVTSLATDLHAHANFELWLTELASPGLVKWVGRNWGKKVAAGNAPFVFGPADAKGFFAARGWNEREFSSSILEGVRLNRTIPMFRLWSVIGKLLGGKRQEEIRRFSGVSLLARGTPRAVPSRRY